MSITREQANLLADLARTIRPAWDTRAIVSSIGEVTHRPLAEIAAAVVLVSENREYTTPKALTFEGPHWRPAGNSAPRHPRHSTTVRDEITVVGQQHLDAARTTAAAAKTAWDRRKEQQ